MTGDVTEWRWALEGREQSTGTLEHSMEDEGVMSAEHPAEVLEWLAQRGPWDMIDPDEPFSVRIERADRSGWKP